MGLDMYLNCIKFVSDYDEGGKELQQKISKLFPKMVFKPSSVKFEVMYWRKANAIHKWFVDNIQEGQDDCRSYDVSLEQLKDLLDKINKILGGRNSKEKVIIGLSGIGNQELAHELLPTQEGFFFGEKGYDEYYFEDLKNTKEMLDNLFKNKKQYEGLYFEYSSSW